MMEWMKKTTVIHRVGRIKRGFLKPSTRAEELLIEVSILLLLGGVRMIGHLV
jgi:hypothetical protein